MEDLIQIIMKLCEGKIVSFVNFVFKIERVYLVKYSKHTKIPFPIPTQSTQYFAGSEQGGENTNWNGQTGLKTKAWGFLIWSLDWALSFCYLEAE